MSRQRPDKKADRGGALSGLTQPGLYLLILAGCGWLILIANLFGFAGASGWLFPETDDIPGLTLSILLLLILGLTPLAVKQMVRTIGGRKP